MAQAAKTPAKSEPPAEASAAPAKRSGGKLLLIVLLIAVFMLLLAVVGVGALLIMKKNGGNSGHEATSETVAIPPPPPPQTAIPSVIDINKPPVFVPLEQFSVNLRTASDDDDPRYLQAAVVLRVADEPTAEALKKWMPGIRDCINRIMSSKLPADIRDDRGRERLADEIKTQLNAMFGVPPPPPGARYESPQGPVLGVLFDKFLFQ
ncbi:MAG: flagellar basal body-associated FliL family protein [Azoarcus sp.]|jgi:flagellar FliL protein|nr:flagellar basal body-associated FliL family protein [Azoarcus sp.]